AEARSLLLELRDVQAILQGVDANDLAAQRRHQVVVVDDELMHESIGVALVRHVFKVAQRVRIRERAVLAPALDVIAALDVVQAAILAPVRAGVDAADVVDGDAEGVAATLGEQLEDVILRVIAPDRLTEKVDRLAVLLQLDLDLGGAGAAMRAVDPAVWTPA